MDDRRILHAFLKDYLKDQIRGQVRSLEEYQHLHPGHEDLIARQWAVYEEGGGLGADAMAAQGMSAWLKEGESLGSFRILRELGRGGQGVVYLAEDQRLHRQVALKVLTGMGPGAEGAVRRFQREAQVASRLEHPGICSIHDAGLEDGIPYIAMRYVKGETLAAKIADTRAEAAERATWVSVTTSTGQEAIQSGEDPSFSSQSSAMTRVELNQILELFESAARALHAAHEAGVVHRDIKPGNIMVTPEGKPVILDFGLAHDEVGDLPSLTATGDIFGTPAYMSPEQIAAKRMKVDRRTDVYSLGVVLFECLTMQRPFEAPTREGLYQSIMTKEPPDPRRFNKNISRDLLAVLQAALEKDSDRRYQTAEAFAQDLKAMRELRPVQVKPIGPLGRLIRWSKRSPFQAASLILLITIISGASFYIAKLPEYRRNRQRAEEIEAQERQERAEGFIQDGFQELLEANNPQAITEFEQALELSPKNTESIAGIVVAHLALDDPLAALGVLRRYEELARDHVSLQAAKAEALRAAGRKAEAAELERALAKPKRPSDFFFLGYLQMKRGGEGEVEAYARAVHFFTQAVLHSPSPRLLYYVKRAGAATMAKDIREAREFVDVLSALWPESAYAWYGRGFALSGAEDPTLQIAAYRKAIALRPDYHIAWFNLGLVLKNANRLEDAMVAYRKALEIRPGFHNAWLGLGIALGTQGRLEDAVVAFRKALKIKPDVHEAWYGIGKAQNDQGRYDDAILAFEEALAIKPDDHQAWHHIGWARLGQKRYDDAIKAFKKALEKNPDYHFAWFGIGYAQTDQGRYDEALEACAKALAIKSDSYQTWALIGAIRCEHLGRYDEAILAFEEALAIKPDDHQAWYGIGKARLGQKRYDDAIKAFKKALEKKPDYHFAWFCIGCAQKDQGRYDEAILAFEEALAIKPDYAEAHCKLGNALKMQGKHDRAIAAYGNAIRVRPDYAEAHNNLGWALGAQGRFEEAIAALNDALRTQPTHAMAHRGLMRALQETGASDRLHAELARWTSVKPTDAEAHHDLALNLLRVGRKDEDLADPEAAVTAARKAVALTKEQDSKMLQTLALALGESDQAEEAITVCEKALKLIEKQEQPDTQLKADLERALKWLKGAAGKQEKSRQQQ